MCSARFVSLFAALLVALAACQPVPLKDCPLTSWRYDEQLTVDTCWGNDGEQWSELRTGPTCPGGPPPYLDDAPDGACRPTATGWVCAWDDAGRGAPQHQRIEARVLGPNRAVGRRRFVEERASGRDCVVEATWSVARRP